MVSGPEQVKYGAQVQLAAGGLNVFHRRVHGRREEKRDAGFAQAGGQPGGRQVDVHAEGFHHVGRAALGADAAIAVLGYAHSRAGGHESDGSGNVEGAGSVSAGAAGVDQGIAAGAADIDGVAVVAKQRRGSRANGLREADNLLDRFALHMQCDQQRANLGVGGFAAQDFGHDVAGLVASERGVVVGDLVQRVEDHERSN